MYFYTNCLVSLLLIAFKSFRGYIIQRKNFRELKHKIVGNIDNIWLDEKYIIPHDYAENSNYFGNCIV